MAKTQAELIRELTATVNDLRVQLRVLDDRVANLQTEAERRTRRDEDATARSATSDERVAQLRAEVNNLREELRRVVERLAASEAKNAALDERSRQHEKTSDRGWNIGQAAIISVISMIGGALLSLLVQLAIKK